MVYPQSGGRTGLSVVAGTGAVCCGRNEAGDYITAGE
mgnify:FL=1